MSASDKEHPLITALKKTVEIFEGQKIAYALIGGLAAAFYGAQRPTADIDLLFALEKIALDGLLQRFQNADFSVAGPSVLEGLSRDGYSQISYHGVRIDLFMPVLPFFATTLKRAKKLELLGAKMAMASPEDLILFKLIAFRDQDQKDIKAILALLGKDLDSPYLWSWAEQLTKPDDGKVSWLREWHGKLC